MGSTINGYVPSGVTLGTTSSPPTTYASPLTVTNSGTVVSGTAGQAILGPNGNAWSVVNYGIVQGGGGDGVTLASGGNVANGAAAYPMASITGYTGIDIHGAAGTVANSGVIAGSGTTSGAAGVILYAG